VDTELNRLETLGDDDLEILRRRRIAEMKRQAERRREWRFNGHGHLSHLSEKEFFDVTKKSERVVLCFYRPGSNRYSDDLIHHLRKLAENHLEAKFVVLDATKSPFLTDRLKIWCLPSITLIVKGRTDKTFHGLGEISPKGNLDTLALEQVLFDSNILTNTALSDEKKVVDEDDDI